MVVRAAEGKSFAPSLIFMSLTRFQGKTLLIRTLSVPLKTAECWLEHWSPIRLSPRPTCQAGVRLRSRRYHPSFNIRSPVQIERKNGGSQGLSSFGIRPGSTYLVPWPSPEQQQRSSSSSPNSDRQHSFFRDFLGSVLFERVPYPLTYILPFFER